MKCIILASGFGTRLYPLTMGKAKALLEYRGDTLINHIINQVPRNIEVFVTTNTKFEDDFRRWIYSVNRPVTLCVEPVYTEDERLGAIGSIDYCITQQSICDDVLVIGSDNYFEFSLEEFIAAFNGKTTLVAAYDMTDRNKCTQFGVVQLQGRKIVEFEEKPVTPKSSMVATACWILPSRILPAISDVVNSGITDNMGDFIAHLVATDEVHAYVFNELWIDVGNLDVYYNTR